MRATWLFLLVATACAEGLPVDDDLRPAVLGMSKSKISLGDNIEFIGGNFIHGNGGHTDINFRGRYNKKDGGTEAVNLTYSPYWLDGNTLSLRPFGPFRIPFSQAGNELGTFEGEITAINYPVDERGKVLPAVVSAPIQVTLEMLPSLVVKEFQPLGANCEQPSPIVLGGFPYKLSVEAVGFSPVNFSYSLEGGRKGFGVRTSRKQALGAVDTVGMNPLAGDELKFDEVRDDLPFYIGILTASAMDNTGYEYKLSLPFGVHRPIEYIDSRRFEVAEFFAPQPMTSCYTGGNGPGAIIDYTETNTETRSRTLDFSFTETFQEQAEVGYQTATTNGVTITNFDLVSEGSNHSFAAGYNHGWSANSSVKGEFSLGGGLIPGGVSIGPTIGGGYNHGWSELDTAGTSVVRQTGQTVATQMSTTNTESWAFSKTEGYNLTNGESNTVSSSSSEAKSYTGLVLSGMYGVLYRQTTRFALPGSIVTYSLCGEPSAVGETVFTDYQWGLDLAQGTTCNPMPDSNFPEAECFQPPCSQ